MYEINCGTCFVEKLLFPTGIIFMSNSDRMKFRIIVDCKNAVI